jgi:hypothetical protein
MSNFANFNEEERIFTFPTFMHKWELSCGDSKHTATDCLEVANSQEDFLAALAKNLQILCSERVQF